MMPHSPRKVTHMIIAVLVSYLTPVLAPLSRANDDRSFEAVCLLSLLGLALTLAFPGMSLD